MRLLFCIFLFFSVIPAFTQTKTLAATRSPQAIRIDGVLSETSWAAATAADGFTQYFPTAGAPATAATEVKVLYDDDAIYIGAKLYDDPALVRKQFTARDEEEGADADYFSVFFDTYHDQQNGFQFLVTSRNVQTDARLSAAYTSVMEDVGDKSWDAVWNSKTAFTKDGWTVEMRIPYISLRFSKEEVQTWGIQFGRFLRRNSEMDFWNPVNPNVAGLVNQFGLFENISSIRPPLRLSFSPYLSGGVHQNPEGSAQGTEWLRSGGMDVKWGLNESFTLDATLIPDFGQVISDNVVNNLTPFEVQFQENRPFFTEGTELFNKAGLFYSRRIGATPGSYYDVLDFADEEPDWKIEKNPALTQLYNAIKFSGRTKNKLGIGIFNALTAPMQARLYHSINGADTAITTEPLTNYNIIVLDQAFKGRSYLTFTNTNVTRAGAARDANVTGLDFAAYDKTNTYVLSGNARYSKIFGNTPYSGFVSALFDTVHANGNIWLKPYDGYTTRLRLGKVSGLWRYNLSTDIFSDHYDPNDLGYLANANEVNYSANVSYNQYTSTKNLINYSYRFSAEYEYLYKPYKRSGLELNLSGFWLFKNMWDVRLIIGGEPIWKHDYFELRTPGKFLKMPKYGYIVVGGSTDSRKRLFINYEMGFAEAVLPDNPYYEINIGARYRFSNKLSLSIESERQQDRGQIGYAFERESNGDPIIGFRQVKDMNMVLSGIYNFTPRMNLTLRARHYWSNVHYQSFHNVSEDGGYKPRAFINGRDYDFNAFNVDAFFTWDFKPGSRIVAGYKNWLGDDYMIAQAGQNYTKNFSSTLELPHGNELTLRVIFFLDYNQLRKKLSK